MADRIAVCLSGGVDSLLALHLVLDRGEPVVGLHALLAPLSSESDRLVKNLRAYCRHLGIELIVPDLREQFRKKVINPFVEGYAGGLTPNPCCTCNLEIKFGLIRKTILNMGIERMATGHYASLASSDVDLQLKRGRDRTKDQTYFLSLVPKSSFAGVFFPLADWLKSDAVKELARRGISPFSSKESQEVCFVPKDYRSFLRQHCTALSGPGPVKTADGKILGEHSGLWNYTQGQRRGLGIAHSFPLYVLDKDLAQNTLLVGPAEDLWESRFNVCGLNLWSPVSDWPAQVRVRTRYRQQAGNCSVQISDSGLTVRLVEKQHKPTPGQVAVFYDSDDRVLGGGVICF